MGLLPDLDRRLSRRIDQHKGIQLSPDDLDLLVSSGAYDTLKKAAAEYQRNQCRARHARSRSINGANMPSIDGRGAPTLKSSGTTPSESASEALARARQMSGKAG
ncbi:hypothetical protein TomTYG75_06660 [Sphingobium sp. TomTYG75]